jgi:hypothetical protein
MNKCKNPECQKEIQDNQNYCSEQCVKRYIEIKKEQKKKPIQLINLDAETINEITEICNVFGFKHTDGLVVGSHNATILGYLRQHQEEVYSTTVDKLTWLCHMSARYLKENYLKGIEAYGIIETFTNEFGVIKWRWIGIKALRNNGYE